jgi:hypothetical protein
VPVWRPACAATRGLWHAMQTRNSKPHDLCPSLHPEPPPPKNEKQTPKPFSKRRLETGLFQHKIRNRFIQRHDSKQVYHEWVSALFPEFSEVQVSSMRYEFEKKCIASKSPLGYRSLSLPLSPPLSFSPSPPRLPPPSLSLTLSLSLPLCPALSPSCSFLLSLSVSSRETRVSSRSSPWFQEPPQVRPRMSRMEPMMSV